MPTVIFNPFRHGKEPDQVTGQSASADSTSQITVSWNAVTASPAVTNYTIEWSANGSSGWAEIAESPTASTSIADASLSTYTTYYYRIKANNPVGSGDYSANASAITNGVVPAQVTGLTATLDGDDVDLAWNVPSFNTPASGTYTVQRSTSSGSGFSDIVSSHGTNSYTDSAPTTGFTYYYQVKAVNAYGSGAYSSEASILVPSPPDALICANSESGQRDSYDYLNVATTGNSSHNASENTLIQNYAYCCGCASTTRGYVFATFDISYTLRICVITIATHGAGTDYGDLDNAGTYQASGSSNGTYCLRMGGHISGTYKDFVDRWTDGTTGSASAYGDLQIACGISTSNIRNSSRWVTALGSTPSTSPIDYSIYGSFTSSATSSTFGDLDTASNYRCGISNSTKGLIVGGNGTQTSAEYITIASTGASTTQDDCDNSQGGIGVGNSTRAVVAGGTGNDSMQYIEFSSTGSWQDFGDMNFTRRDGAGCSHF